MLLTKLKIAKAALLVIALLGAGLTGLNYHVQAAEPTRVEQTEPIKEAKAEKPEAPPGPNDEAVKSQIAKVLKAHGGAESLEKLKTFTMRVKTSCVIADDNQDQQYFVQPPDQVRLELKRDGRENEKLIGKLIFVKNGDKKWRKIDDGETVDHAEFTAEAAELVKYFGPRAILRLNDPAMKVSMLGERMVGDTDSVFGDRAAICVKVARKDGKDFPPLHCPSTNTGKVGEVLLYFDKDSGLLLKEEWDAQNSHHEIFCADYKMINGVAVAQKLIRRMDGGVNYRSEVEFNVVDKLDAKLFQKP